MGKLWLDIMIWNIFKSWWNPRSINKIGTGPAQSVGHWSRAPLLGRNNGVLHEDLFHQDEYKVRNYKFPFRTQNRAGRPAQRGEKRQTFCFCTNLSPVGSVRRQGGRSRCPGAWLELEGRRTFSQGCRGGRPDVNMSTGGAGLCYHHSYSGCQWYYLLPLSVDCPGCQATAQSAVWLFQMSRGNPSSSSSSSCRSSNNTTF